MSYSYRYHWSETGSHGCAGEIPGLLIRKNEPLPPLEYLNAAKLNSKDANNLHRSNLMLYWETVETRIALVTRCRADDDRIKPSYQKFPDIARQIATLITYNISDQRSYQPLLLNRQLPQDQIPIELVPHIRQIEVWQGFVEEHRALISPRFGAAVSDDGYYSAIVGSSSITFPGEVREFYGEKLFSFDPQTDHPTLEEDCAWWILPNPKVKIVLPFNGCSNILAETFGFLEQAEAYQKQQEQKKSDMEASYMRNEELEKQKLRNEEKRTLEKLLS